VKRGDKLGGNLIIIDSLKGKEEIAMSQEKRYFSMGMVSLVALIMLTGWVEPAQAQKKYPTESIEIIVPYNPGGATDVSARIMADYMSKKWGVPINVVNKPAGVRVPACLELYSAKPDGYTLLQDGMGSSSQLPLAVQNLPFKIMDRTFIAIFADTPTVYVVRPDSPIKTMKDVEAEVKKDPGSFTWNSLGGAGSYDNAMRIFLREIGVDVKKTRPVVVKGGAEGVTLTAAGSLKLGLATFSSCAASIGAKIVRPVAITTNKRNPNFPDIPTVVEQGYPNATQADRYGPSGPPNLPSHIVEVWEKALEEMVKDPEVIKKLEHIGLTPLFQNSRETRERVAKEMEQLRILYELK
jgi:tripartite-type tricarboxylate transporter receptor subunit TctC